MRQILTLKHTPAPPKSAEEIFLAVRSGALALDLGIAQAKSAGYVPAALRLSAERAREIARCSATLKRLVSARQLTVAEAMRHAELNGETDPSFKRELEAAWNVHNLSGAELARRALAVRMAQAA